MLLAVLALGAGCVGIAVDRRYAPPPTPPQAEDSGTLTLGQFALVDEFQADKRRLEVDVEYVNDTEWSFSEIVAWCRAIDARGYQLGARRLLLASDEVGPIEPGFKIVRRVFIWVQTRAPVERVACRITDVS